MIQAAPWCLIDGEPGGAQHVDHLVRCLGAAGGGVLNLIQLGGKTIKVMDGFELRRGADGGDAGVPMRTHHHDGAWGL